MADNKNVKVDPKKVKEDLQAVFSNVLGKLKSKNKWKKIWIECQEYGSIFWVFLLNEFYLS